MNAIVTTSQETTEFKAHTSDCVRLMREAMALADRALDNGANYFAATGARHAAEIKENGFTGASPF